MGISDPNQAGSRTAARVPSSVATTEDKLQALFEKISDAYPDGTVECQHATSEYIDLQFLRAGVTEVGHVRLFLLEAQVDALHVSSGTLDLVKVVDHCGGGEIFMSPVVSALIAVSTR